MKIYRQREALIGRVNASSRKNKTAGEKHMTAMTLAHQHADIALVATYKDQ